MGTPTSSSNGNSSTSSGIGNFSTSSSDRAPVEAHGHLLTLFLAMLSAMWETGTRCLATRDRAATVPIALRLLRTVWLRIKRTAPAITSQWEIGMRHNVIGQPTCCV